MRPLDGWILAQVEGKAYLGKPPTGWTEMALAEGLRSRPVILEPVYEFQFLAMPTPQGMQMAPTLRSPWGCTSIAGLTLPRPGVWVALAALSDDERRVFEALVTQTEEGLRQARAAAAGITLAGAGTKLPPMHPGTGGRR
jgi:hypothetical protein